MSPRCHRCCRSPTALSCEQRSSSCAMTRRPWSGVQQLRCWQHVIHVGENCGSLDSVASGPPMHCRCLVTHRCVSGFHLVSLLAGVGAICGDAGAPAHSRGHPACVCGPHTRRPGQRAADRRQGGPGMGMEAWHLVIESTSKHALCCVRMPTVDAASLVQWRRRVRWPSCCRGMRLLQLSCRRRYSAHRTSHGACGILRCSRCACSSTQLPQQMVVRLLVCCC